jgi:hypothetical protein
MLSMGYSTISMAIFNSYVKLPEGIIYIYIYMYIPSNPLILPIPQGLGQVSGNIFIEFPFFALVELLLPMHFQKALSLHQPSPSESSTSFTAFHSSKMAMQTLHVQIMNRILCKSAT